MTKIVPLEAAARKHLEMAYAKYSVKYPHTVFGVVEGDLCIINLCGVPFEVNTCQFVLSFANTGSSLIIPTPFNIKKTDVERLFFAGHTDDRSMFEVYFQKEAPEDECKMIASFVVGLVGDLQAPVMGKWYQVAKSFVNQFTFINEQKLGQGWRHILDIQKILGRDLIVEFLLKDRMAVKPLLRKLGVLEALGITRVESIGPLPDVICLQKSQMTEQFDIDQFRKEIVVRTRQLTEGL